MKITKDYHFSGVYCIFNSINGKKYVGSSKNIYCRWQKHRALLRKGTHWNGHLQNAWNKYGEEAFKFIVLLKCKETDLLAKEQSYIDSLKPEYNIMLEAKRTYMSDLMRKHVSDGVKRAIKEGRLPLNPMIGKKMTLEHLAKLPQNQKGYKCPKRQKGAIILDDDNNIIASFHTLKEAAAFLDVTYSAISWAIRNKRHCKGYLIKR